MVLFSSSLHSAAASQADSDGEETSPEDKHALVNVLRELQDYVKWFSGTVIRVCIIYLHVF